MKLLGGGGTFYTREMSLGPGAGPGDILRGAGGNIL